MRWAVRAPTVEAALLTGTACTKQEFIIDHAFH